MNFKELLQNRLAKSCETSAHFKIQGFNQLIEDGADDRWLLNFLLIFPFYLLILIHSSRIAIDAPVKEFNGYYSGSCKTIVSSGGRGSPSKSTTLSIIGNGINFKFNLNNQPFLCDTTIFNFSIVSDSAIYFNQQDYILSAKYRQHSYFKKKELSRSIEEINKNEIDQFNLFMLSCYVTLFLMFACGMTLFGVSSPKSY